MASSVVKGLSCGVAFIVILETQTNYNSICTSQGFSFVSPGRDSGIVWYKMIYQQDWVCVHYCSSKDHSGLSSLQSHSVDILTSRVVRQGGRSHGRGLSCCSSPSFCVGGEEKATPPHQHISCNNIPKVAPSPLRLCERHP